MIVTVRYEDDNYRDKSSKERNFSMSYRKLAPFLFSPRMGREVEVDASSPSIMLSVGSKNNMKPPTRDRPENRLMDSACQTVAWLGCFTILLTSRDRSMMRISVRGVRGQSQLKPQMLELGAPE